MIHEPFICKSRMDTSSLPVLPDTLEIKVNGSWIEVNDWIFRSWAGERRKNGTAFKGPVYYLGTNTEAPTAK